MLPTSSGYIVLSGFIPFIFAVLGGLFATIFTPSNKLSSILQHFVSGIVLAAVAVELLPNILVSQSKWTIALGFLAGVFLIIGIHKLSHFLENHFSGYILPLGYIVAIAIDLFIDGILIAVSYLSGKSSGLLIAFSLSLCAFLLCLSLGISLGKKNLPKTSQITWFVILGLMLPLGAFVGVECIDLLPKSFMVEILSLGVAALLFLACEELIKDAHKTEDTIWDTFIFFIGFLIILLFRL